MREFKSAKEMSKITATYRMDEMMLDLENQIVNRAKAGHWYLVYNVVSCKEEYHVINEDITFIFNELYRAGYDVVDEGETWVIKWNVI